MGNMSRRQSKTNQTQKARTSNSGMLFLPDLAATSTRNVGTEKQDAGGAGLRKYGTPENATPDGPGAAGGSAASTRTIKQQIERPTDGEGCRSRSCMQGVGFHQAPTASLAHKQHQGRGVPPPSSSGRRGPGTAPKLPTYGLLCRTL